MRFLPINLDNVSNAATLYVKIKNVPPHNMNWTYSSAYARLSAEIKTVGFEGYIVFGENGMPAGFLMGHSEVREDGKSNFLLREFCFENGASGRASANAALLHLSDALNSRCIDTLIILSENTEKNAEFFTSLGFSVSSDLLCMQKICE